MDYMRGCLFYVLSALLVALLCVGLLLIPILGKETTPVPEGSMYVSEGLVIHLDAFSPDNGTVDLSTGAWRSLSGGGDATLDGSWVKEEKGISYSLSAVGGTGLHFDFADLPKEDFTAEMFLTPKGLETGGQKVTFDSDYGKSYSYGFAFGPFKGYVYPAKRVAGDPSPTADSRYCSWQIMWYYAETGYNFTWLLDDYSFHTFMDRPLSYAVTGQVGASSASYRILAQGEEAGRVNISSAKYKPYDSCDSMFRLLTSFPCTVYSVRIYDRVLTAEEMAQNHLADLAAYHELSIAERFLSLSPSRQKEICARFAKSSPDEAGLAEAILAEVNRLTAEDLLLEDPKTEEELAQAHFALLAKEAELDISCLEPLSAEERAAVFRQFATLSPSTHSKELLQNLLHYYAGDTEALMKGALSLEEISLRNDTVTGVRHLFRLEAQTLAILSQDYQVTVGALLSLSSSGLTPESLTLTYKDGAWQAPQGAAMITVYSQNGTHPVNGHFLPEDPERFAVTLSLGEELTREKTQNGVLALGFLILEKEGERLVYYKGGISSLYGPVPSYETIAKMDYMKDKTNEVAMENYTDCLQGTLKEYYKELGEYPVLISGKDAPLPGGEKAVWVQYLPEKDPWVGHSDPDRAGVKAVYVYYPMAKDPATLTDAALEEMGALRFFGYIGLPSARSKNLPGMVCTHGGAGHAYATYVLEAIKHGFAAIAMDTEGYYNTTGGTTTYSEAGAAYVQDPLGHKGKDNFSSVEGPFEDQWLYYAVGDAILSNSVLRSAEGVVPEEVGITGISWGGLIVSTTICFDQRLAFCVPVYISFHMAESLGTSVGSLPNRPFAAALWQDPDLIAASQVPTMILASDRDKFASVNTSSATYHDLADGYLTIKPNFGHSQQAGASPAEIYYFALSILGRNGGLAEAEEQPTVEDGRNYILPVYIPSNYEGFSATLYYRTTPIPSYDSDATRPQWESKRLSVDREAGEVTVEVPKDACIYYISFCGTDPDIERIKQTTPNADAFAKGTLYSSTDIVVFD